MEKPESSSLNSNKVEQAPSSKVKAGTSPAERRQGVSLISNQLGTLDSFKQNKSPQEIKLGKLCKDGLKNYNDARNKEGAWNKYLESINKFRHDELGFQPIQEAPASLKFRIGDAMQRGNEAELLRIFEEEGKFYGKINVVKRSWEAAKEIPVVNVAQGVIGGAAQLTSAVGSLLDDATVAIGMQRGTEAERAQAKEVIKNVARNLITKEGWKKFAKGALRVEEYRDAIKGDGVKIGYVIGNHLFDLATILITPPGSKIPVEATKTTVTAAAAKVLAREAIEEVAYQAGEQSAKTAR